jgi:hypothetical protein
VNANLGYRLAPGAETRFFVGRGLFSASNSESEPGSFWSVS